MTEPMVWPDARRTPPAGLPLNAEPDIPVSGAVKPLDRDDEPILVDPLTGLVNRRQLEAELEDAVSRCERSGKMLAVLFAHLSGVEEAHDGEGRQVTDPLLMAFAGRLARLVPPNAHLGRVARTEFVLVCEDLDDTATVAPLAARIVIALSNPFAVSRTTMTVRSHVGVSYAGRPARMPRPLF